MQEELRDAIKAVKAATDGRPAKGYAEVTAVDVVLIGAAVPKEKHTEITRGLAVAAARANPRSDLDLKVVQTVGHLRQLLDLAPPLPPEPDPAPAEGGA